MIHLWEYDHPYYCAEATWRRNADGTLNHRRWESWADFRDETIFTTGDRDLNLLVRWDWKRYEPDPYDPSSPPTGRDELSLFFVMQRKGYLCSHAIAVGDDDEPEVRAFLEACARTTTALWAPLLDTTPEPRNG